MNDEVVLSLLENELTLPASEMIQNSHKHLGK